MSANNFINFIVFYHFCFYFSSSVLSLFTHKNRLLYRKSNTKKTIILLRREYYMYDAYSDRENIPLAK